MMRASMKPPMSPSSMVEETGWASPPLPMYCDQGHRAATMRTTRSRNDLSIVPFRVMPSTPMPSRGRRSKVFSFRPGLPVRRTGRGIEDLLWKRKTPFYQRRAAGGACDCDFIQSIAGCVERLVVGALRVPQRLLLAFPVDPLVDLLPVNGNFLRRVDAAAHLVAFDAEDSKRHVVADHDGLAHSSREDKHTLRAPCCLTLSALARGNILRHPP